MTARSAKYFSRISICFLSNSYELLVVMMQRHEGHDVLAPEVEGFSFLGLIGVPVIDRCNASSESTGMTQNAFNDVRLNKLGQAGCNTSSDVVDNPRLFQPGSFIKCSLSL